MEAPHLIQPHELGAGTRYGSGRWRGEDVWQVLTAARAGDLAALRGALERDSSLVSASYWYMPPLHFAVREGHLEAVRLLVAAGADLTHRNALYGNDTLLQMAEDRGHRQVAGFLREALDRRLSSAGVRHAVHEAVAGGDAAGLTRLLAADSRLADRGDHLGRRPLHYAVAAGRGDLVDLLLNAGADIDALGFGGDDRLGGAGFRPVALALWRDPYWGPRDDSGQAARRLLLRSAAGARLLRVPPVVTYCPTYLWRALPLARLLCCRTWPSGSPICWQLAAASTVAPHRRARRHQIRRAVPGVRRRPRRGRRGIPLHAAGMGGALRTGGVRAFPVGASGAACGTGSGAGVGAAARLGTTPRAWGGRRPAGAGRLTQPRHGVSPPVLATTAARGSG